MSKESNSKIFKVINSWKEDDEFNNIKFRDNTLLISQVNRFNYENNIQNDSGFVIENINRGLVDDEKFKIKKCFSNNDFCQESLDYFFYPKAFRGSLFKHLRKDFYTCEEALMVVPFFTLSHEINSYFKKNEKLKKITIITTTFDENASKINFSILEKLKKDHGDKIDIKVELVSSNQDRLHSKLYYFKRGENLSSLISGSSNFTWTGLETGKEWNTRIPEFSNPDILEDFLEEFNFLYDKENVVDIFDEKIEIWKKRQKDFLANFESKTKIEDINNNEDEKVQFENNLSLFSYQENAINSLIKRFESGKRKHLIVMATGTGKTVLSAAYVNEIKKRNIHTKPIVFFVSHRQEILDQAKKTLIRFCGYKEEEIMEVFSGRTEKLSEKTGIKLYLFSVQTLIRRREEFENIRSDLTIFDEAHHIDEKAKSFLEIFNWSVKNSNEVLGLTATPLRTNGNNVANLFDGECAFFLTLFNEVKLEYLSSFDYYMIGDDKTEIIDIDITKNRELAKILSNDRRNQLVYETIDEYLFTYNKNVSCVIFCASIDHAKSVSDYLISKNINSEYLVSEGISLEQRIKILEDFKNKKINYLCVVDIFNEGIDIPGINTIFFLRPTDSQLIFMQQLGRGLRKLAGKKLKVFDIVNNISISKNKNYNKMNLISCITDDLPSINFKKNFSEIENYLPTDCDLQINNVAQEILKKHFLSLEKNLKIVNPSISDSQKDYICYKNLMNNSFLSEISNYYSDQTFFDSNKIFINSLLLFSVINSKQLLEEFKDILIKNEKSKFRYVNNLFIRNIYNHTNPLRGKNIDEIWSSIFNLDENFKKEIIFICDFKLENCFLINRKMTDDINCLKGTNFFKVQIASLLKSNIENYLTGSVDVPAAVRWNNGSNKDIYIACQMFNKENIHENSYDQENNILTYYATPEWKEFPKIGTIQSSFQSSDSNKYAFFNPGWEGIFLKNNNIFTLLGKVQQVNGPLSNKKRKIYYTLVIE